MLCYVAENMEKLVLGGGSYSQSGFYFSAQKTEDFEPNLRIREEMPLESAEKRQKRPPIPSL